MDEPLQQSQSELAAARGIIATLDHLPLALEIAGAYLKHSSNMTIEHYQQLLGGDANQIFEISDSAVNLTPLLKDILLLDYPRITAWWTGS